MRKVQSKIMYGVETIVDKSKDMLEDKEEEGTDDDRKE